MAEPKSAHRWGRLVTPVVAAIIVVGGYFGWRAYSDHQALEQAAQAQAKPPTAVPVSVGKVEKADFPVYLEGLGIVQAFNNVLVRTRVDGQIIKLAVKEGQDVKSGDVIAQIDPRPYQATLDQAVAKKAQDEANLKNAGLDLDRYNTLAKQNFATGQQLDTQRSTVTQATAQIASDQAAIDNAKTELGYASIAAPISGRTGIRMVDQGNIIHASDTTGIITIQQLHPISLIFTAPQEDVTRINKAQALTPLKVSALNSDRSKTLSQGELSVVNNQVDTATGTIELKATFANTDNVLWPGLSVATNLLVETIKDATTIPNGAIEHGPTGLYVFTVDEANKVHIQAIKVQENGDKTSVVSDGLKVGQAIVTDGQYRLQEGTLVKASNAPEKTAAIN